jgi:predicted AAA+ superfamily ATPase
LFEQWVGIELWKRLVYLGEGSLHHLRSKDGAEIDFIVERKGRYIPIEVKLTEHPTLSDARQVLSFIFEQKGKAKHGYVICRAARPLALHPQVTALPWFML